MNTYPHEETKKLMFEIEKVDRNEGIVKEVIVIDNPLAGSFKVSNGKVIAYIYLNNKSVEVFLLDNEGKIKNKEISLE